MIIYLVSFCLFFTFLNSLLLMNLSNSLLKFYEFYRTQKIDQKTSVNSKSPTPDKGLVDLNEVGTYDARFQIGQK